MLYKFYELGATIYRCFEKSILQKNPNIYTKSHGTLIFKIVAGMQVASLIMKDSV